MSFVYVDITSCLFASSQLAEITCSVSSGNEQSVVHMFEVSSGLTTLLVAAAEEEVAEAALKAGAHVSLTDPDLPSGSDRVHAALEAFDPERRFDVAVNLQGDMPTMRAADVARALAALKPGADIATLVSPSSDESERANPNVVKAIRAADGRRSEERRVGKECSLPCRSRWSPYH